MDVDPGVGDAADSAGQDVDRVRRACQLWMTELMPASVADPAESSRGITSMHRPTAPPVAYPATRRGRGTSSPPQLGQTFRISSAQGTQ
ncbi:hypothetical protein SVEN_4176 [Streptomyces venezuelae ATCC 10712]|uniref:Uncharacterized protein n=1 Tax=Streptomyces venezuelae (strain ATCC 10712 / CBS 650.69 / DSM 40230 / JCM 4526 / NBRC 13096 / PD 04745) TaxID=953739 RepID=F2RHD4_STRVP|nr:hypothetical protein SVEN_4176 [Streptomyces venezuelae ATCC 10712]